MWEPASCPSSVSEAVWVHIFPRTRRLVIHPVERADVPSLPPQSQPRDLRQSLSVQDSAQRLNVKTNYNLNKERSRILRSRTVIIYRLPDKDKERQWIGSRGGWPANMATALSHNSIHVPRHPFKMPIDVASLVFSGSSFKSRIVLGKKE